MGGFIAYHFYVSVRSIRSRAQLKSSFKEQKDHLCFIGAKPSAYLKKTPQIVLVLLAFEREPEEIKVRNTDLRSVNATVGAS